MQKLHRTIAEPGSAHRRRQRSCLAVYGAVVAGSTGVALALPLSGPLRAALLGLAFPGSGFLQWAGGGQVLAGLGFAAAGLLVFAAALVLWFATGNVLAPIASWIACLWLAARPDLFGLDGGAAAPGWPLALGPAIFAALGIAWLRAAEPPPAAPAFAACLRAPPPRSAAECPELGPDDLKRVQLLLDRALQPAERFAGFELRDQFQTAALRYQVNFVALALATFRHNHAPAADAPFAAAQERLVAKIGDRRLWRYWRLENAWGHLRLGADPVAAHNIMYSGFTALQLALGDRPELALHDRGRVWRRYGLGEIAALLEDQYRTARHGLLCCEPNWIYPLCNLITMTAVKAADARLGTGRWDALGAAFLASLQREAMRPDGRFIAFRSALTGLAPPAPGGIVMQAFPCLFLNALAPEAAQMHWHRVRRQLDTGSWRRLFWPVDTGNYGFSRASSYAATAAAAVEMGDRAVADECLRRLEHECPSHEADGAIHRARASLWAHALEVMARSGRADGLRDAVSAPPAAGGPRLLRTGCRRTLVASARSDGAGIDLVLQPNGGRGVEVIELGGLRAGAHYATGLAQRPLLRADAEGRGVLRVPLEGRTALAIRPFGQEAGRWSAA